MHFQWNSRTFVKVSLRHSLLCYHFSQHEWVKPTKVANCSWFIKSMLECLSRTKYSRTGFCPFCKVSVVTTGGIILMRRSAFLFPKEAVNCSWVNPSPKTGFDQSDRLWMAGGMCAKKSLLNLLGKWTEIDNKLSVNIEAKQRDG